MQRVLMRTVDLEINGIKYTTCIPHDDESKDDNNSVPPPPQYCKGLVPWGSCPRPCHDTLIASMRFHYKRLRSSVLTDIHIDVNRHTCLNDNKRDKEVRRGRIL